jgi:hypothetical protein
MQANTQATRMEGSPEMGISPLAAGILEVLMVPRTPSE